MIINFDIFDRKGQSLNIGDRIAVYDWSIHEPKFLGIAKIYFNIDEGRIDIDPPLVNDAYDLVTKALPRCEKLA